MKVLLSVYACEPHKGSEPGVGWQFASRLAEHHDVWAVTRANNRPVIEDELQRNPRPRLRVVYHDRPDALRWKKLPGGTYGYYALWQRSLLGPCERLHREVGFDLVHHLTFAQYWAPVHLAQLGPPFLWGPVGGGENVPSSLLNTLAAADRARELLRLGAQRGSELSLALRRTARSAAIALATTAQTGDRLRSLGAGDVRVMPNVAVDARRDGSDGTDEKGAFTIVSMGRLLYWKGVHLGLRAFAAADLPHARYLVVGDGPERGRLEQLARQLGVDERVDFIGSLARGDALTALDEADVLLHPSLHDSGGFVCLEAMSSGVPVICLDAGGPGLHVDDESGIRVKPGPVAGVVRSLTTALESVAADDCLARRLGRGAIDRIEESYTWERRVDEMLGLYGEIAA